MCIFIYRSTVNLVYILLDRVIKKFIFIFLLYNSRLVEISIYKYNEEEFSQTLVDALYSCNLSAWLNYLCIKRELIDGSANQIKIIKNNDNNNITLVDVLSSNQEVF